MKATSDASAAAPVALALPSTNWFVWVLAALAACCIQHAVGGDRRIAGHLSLGWRDLGGMVVWLGRAGMRCGARALLALRVFFDSQHAVFLLGGVCIIGSVALAPLALCEGDGSATPNLYPLVISRPSNLSSVCWVQGHTGQRGQGSRDLHSGSTSPGMWGSLLPNLGDLSEWSFLAADPRHSLLKGAAVSFSLYEPENVPSWQRRNGWTYAIVEQEELLSLGDLFLTLDADGSGLLEPPEIWALRSSILRPYYGERVFLDSSWGAPAATASDTISGTACDTASDRDTDTACERYADDRASGQATAGRQPDGQHPAPVRLERDEQLRVSAQSLAGFWREHPVLGSVGGASAAAQAPDVT